MGCSHPKASVSVRSTEHEAFESRCAWCKQPEPIHDPKCPHRLVMCKTCRSTVVVSEAKAHSMSCKKRLHPNAALLPRREPEAPNDAAAKTAAAEVDDLEQHDRLCVWCKRPAPKEHDAKCRQRRVLCRACRCEIVLSEAVAHRTSCPKR
uniref:TRAF-type domain-containing protein n=1 Tax=Neobodo designis TaxID=312471 RepID=A0A7S1L3D6_NEODS|mmetsp:Transcript_13817/g.43006  ORF Transcript_13817/g.43006 Transcript_13817/m.43006 type:complete len:150 (+) Transcript_13817:59-508(+)